MYHGIVIDKQFKDEDYPNELKVFNKKVSGDWIIYGIGVEEDNLDDFIEDLQINMKDDGPWYAHLYKDDELIVVFKEKVFKVSPHISTWNEIYDFGKSLNIPEDQLTFWPNRFQDERHYFTD